MADGYLAKPANRVVRVAGIPMKGRAGGVYTSVTPLTKRYGVDVGVDGEGMFTDNGNESAAIMIAVMPNSDDNDVLSALYTAGLPVPVTMTEIGSRFVGACARAMITQQAPREWSDGTTRVVWELETTNWSGHHGGAPPSVANTTVPLVSSFAVQ